VTLSVSEQQTVFTARHGDRETASAVNRRQSYPRPRLRGDLCPPLCPSGDPVARDVHDTDRARVRGSCLGISELLILDQMDRPCAAVLVHNQPGILLPVSTLRGRHHRHVVLCPVQGESSGL
jgi:hypothetical protein